MYKNLWKETIEKLESNGFTFDDVLSIYGNDFQITKENFEEIAKSTNYNNGYGGQEVASDLTILGNSFIMTRGEYDGSEWWEFNLLKAGSNEIKTIDKLVNPKRSWCTLAEINNLEEDD